MANINENQVKEIIERIVREYKGGINRSYAGERLDFKTCSP